MKNEFFKKFTALLLAVLMLASLSPLSFADNGEGETEPPATEETQSSADSVEGTEAGDVTPADETGSGDSAEDGSEPEEAPSGDEPGDADPADEGEDPEEGEEGEPGEDGEDEEKSLPYGLNGMPEGWELSDSERRAKERVIASGMPGAMAGLEEGTDYMPGRLIFTCDSYDYALTVAEAYSAELISCEYGIAVIAPQTSSVKECFECALDDAYNLPLVEPDYIVSLVPGGDEGSYADAASAGVPVAGSWRSTVSALSDPDPLLNDPESANYQWFHDVINSYEAWGVTTGSGSVTVAVLDSGINTNHLDLQSGGGRTVTADYATALGSGEDGYGHGTHVAALIAGALGNGTAGAGVAPGVSIVSIKVLNNSGKGSESDIIEGIYKAVQTYGADIINMSLGSNHYSETYYNAVYSAVHDYGTTFVAAMGNYGTNQKMYPAGYNISGVIAVSASNRAGTASYFSNFGSWCDITAPGSDIYSAYTGSSTQTGRLNGTSQASPIVAGACALYMSVYGNPGPAAMERIISNAAEGGILDLTKLFGGTAGSVTLEISSGGEAVEYRAGRSYYADSLIDFSAGGGGGAVIYTTDGSEPAVLNGQTLNCALWSGPVRLDTLAGSGETVTVRTASISGAGIMGEVSSFTLKVGTFMPDSVSLSAPAEIYAGKSVTLLADVLPDGANESVFWSIESFDSAISSAVVNRSSGVFTATLKTGYSSGTVTVKAVSADDDSLFDTAEIVILNSRATKTVTLSASSLTMLTGQTVQVTYSAVDVYGAEVPMAPKWTSSNKKVATVAEDGTITAVGFGTATIKCAAQDGSGKYASLKVTVKVPVESVTITGQAAIAPGKSATYNAKVLPSGASLKTVTWSLSEGAPATVSSTGVVKVNTSATAGESFTVYATAKDGSGCRGEYTVYVTALTKAISIVFPADYANKILFTYDLDATPDRNDSTVTLSASISGGGIVPPKWTSSSSAIATVSGDGEQCTVTAVKPGTVTIKCAAQDGSGKYATVKITVRNPVESITVTGQAAIAPGKSATFKAGVLPSGASLKTVTWSLSEGAPATVSSTGIVKVKTSADAGESFTVFAKAKDGSGTVGSYTVYVTKLTKLITISTPAEYSDRVLYTYDLEETADKADNTVTLSAAVTGGGIVPPKWTTSNESIAAISADGTECTVTALKPGTVTIKCAAQDGSGKYASVKITVKQTAEELTISGLPCMAAGKSSAYKVTVSPSNASLKTVTWSLSEGAPATVSSTGLVKIKAGATVGESFTVYAKSKDIKGVTASYTVTVCALTTSLKISLPSDYSSKILFPSDLPGTAKDDRSVTLTAIVTGNDLEPVQWTSSNSKAVSITQDGTQVTVTALAPGSSTIKCTAQDGSAKYASVTLTVRRPVEEIVITGSDSIKPGKSASFKAAVSPSNASTKTVTWSLSAGAPATIGTTGTVTVKSSASAGESFTVYATAKDGTGVYGEHTVTVGSGGSAVTPVVPDVPAVSGTIKISADPGNRNSIILSPDTPGVDESDTTLMLTGTVTGSISSVLWSSDSEHVATVAQDGTVTAVGPGTAVISLEAQDGSGIKATHTVTVTVRASGISLAPSLPTSTGKNYISPGATTQILYTLGDAYGTPGIRDVEWSFGAALDLDGFQEDITETVLSRRLISFNNGTFTVNSGMSSYLGYDSLNDCYSRVILSFTARTTDGSNLSDDIEFVVIPATTLIRVYNSSQLTTPSSVISLSASSGAGNVYLGITNSLGQVNADADAYTVTSSDPDLVSAIRTSTQYPNRLTLIATRTPYANGNYATGYATITVTANDGSGVKCTFRVHVT